MKIFTRVAIELFLSILIFPSGKESKFGVYEGYSEEKIGIDRKRSKIL